eukprot:362822-Chlamydomonas_euryale.AAC.26
MVIFHCMPARRSSRLFLSHLLQNCVPHSNSKQICWFGKNTASTSNTAGIATLSSMGQLPVPCPSAGRLAACTATSLCQRQQARRRSLEAWDQVIEPANHHDSQHPVERKGIVRALQGCRAIRQHHHVGRRPPCRCADACFVARAQAVAADRAAHFCRASAKARANAAKHAVAGRRCNVGIKLGTHRRTQAVARRHEPSADGACATKQQRALSAPLVAHVRRMLREGGRAGGPAGARA